MRYGKNAGERFRLQVMSALRDVTGSTGPVNGCAFRAFFDPVNPEREVRQSPADEGHDGRSTGRDVESVRRGGMGAIGGGVVSLFCLESCAGFLCMYTVSCSSVTPKLFSLSADIRAISRRCCSSFRFGRDTTAIKTTDEATARHRYVETTQATGIAVVSPVRMQHGVFGTVGERPCLQCCFPADLSDGSMHCRTNNNAPMKGKQSVYVSCVRGHVMPIAQVVLLQEMYCGCFPMAADRADGAFFIGCRSPEK